ncbi:MAG: sel1 repeat family protein [Bacteroidales bacterium]|nr:sel1 repeat family protein [Bacteroidales bacterium]
MGLFDFLKKKPSQNANERASVKSPGTEGASEQHRTASSPKEVDHSPSNSGLSLQERYGKASLKAYQTGEWTEAIKEFKRLEDEGLGEASVALGQYAQMDDKSKALAHFRKAAAKGVAEGSWGCAAIIGHAYQADIDGADKEWYAYCLRAARGGCCDAMNELGNMYNRRNDYLGAFYWYQMAAYYEHPQGYSAAAGTISKYLAAGKPEIASTIDGVRPNDVKSAISIFRCMTKQDILDQTRMDSFMHAAMEDDNEMMGLFIGHFFEDVVKMDGNARMGYQLAAHNNSIIGIKCLADMQASGKGFERNMEAAAGWYQSAADACEKTACFVMGEFLRTKKPNLAAYYYAAALRRGYEPAYQRLLQM